MHTLNESFRMALEMAFLRLPRPRRVRTPLLLLSGENDRIFTVSEQRKTARAYKTDPVIYPGITHDMMLERSWGNVADKILNSLNSRNLSLCISTLASKSLFRHWEEPIGATKPSLTPFS